MARIYGIIALILVILLSVVLIIGASVLSGISDDTDNTERLIIERDVSFDDVLHHHIVSALDGARNGKLELNIDAYDMNELLYALVKKLDMERIGVRSIYIEQTDGIHRLCVPIEIMGTKSLISGDLRLYEDGDTLFAQVSRVSVGDKSIGEGFLSVFRLKSKIVNLLDDNGISSYFVDDVFTLELSRADLGGIISSSVSDNENAGIINALYSLVMIRQDAVNIEIGSPTDISFSADIAAFNGSEQTCFDQLNSYTKQLLDDEVIGRGDIAKLAKYYINGYDRLTDGERGGVTELLSAAQTPEQIASYGGVVEREKVSLLRILLTQFQVSSTLRPSFKISDTDISAMLSDTPLVGTVWQYSSYRDNSCAYIVVQNFDCVIGEGAIDLRIDINLNGYLLSLTAEMLCGKSPVTAIYGVLSNASLGGVDLNYYESDQLFAFLQSKLNLNWISVDRDGLSVTLDFTATFAEDSLLAVLIKNNDNIVTVCKKSLISDGGYIQITF